MQHPNKGNAFEPNVSLTIVATLLLFGGGYPLFEVILAILAILGISVENVVHSWLPRESKPAEKTQQGGEGTKKNIEVHDKKRAKKGVNPPK